MVGTSIVLPGMRRGVEGRRAHAVPYWRAAGIHRAGAAAAAEVGDDDDDGNAADDVVRRLAAAVRRAATRMEAESMVLPSDIAVDNND